MMAREDTRVRADRWWIPTTVATGGMAASIIAVYAVATLAPFLVADLGLSRTAVGGLVTVSFAAAAAGSLFAGHVVDVVGARTGLFALCAAVTVGLAVASVSGAYGWLVLALALAGLGQALANPATNVLVAAAVPPQRRGTAIGVKQGGVQLAAFSAGLALPPVAAAAGWATAVQVSAVLPLAVAVAAYRLVPASGSGARGSWWRWSAPDRWLSWLIGYSLLLGAGLSAVNTYLPLYANQELGFGATAAGALLAAFGVTGLTSRIGWGRWADRAPNVTVALTWLSGAGVVGAALVWLAGISWSPLVWLGAVVVGGSATAANAMSMTAVVRRGIATGAASGLVALGFFAGFVVGPTLFGLIADRTGWTSAWPLVGVVFAGSALVALPVRGGAARAGAGGGGMT